MSNYINILKFYIYSKVQPNLDLYKLVDFQPGIHLFISENNLSVRLLFRDIRILDYPPWDSSRLAPEVRVPGNRVSEIALCAKQHLLVEGLHRF